MKKRIISICLVICLVLCALCSCKKTAKVEDKLHAYPEDQFEICGLWAPHDITEEAFKLYKDAGFNVVSFTNHDEMPRSSENQYFVGSKRTLEALEVCKKVGIDVYLAYGASWFNRGNEGDEYFDNAPFSTHYDYDDYMDIIKGVHINDEPNKETMAQLADDALIADYKKIYGDRKYMINLIPATAVTSRNFETYDEMLEIYGETIMSKFENPYICVDVYPYSNSKLPEQMIIYNYNEIAKCAKKYGAETSFILQSSTGSEFLPELTEADMRQQAYLAIAFGADNLQYYCYSVPTQYSSDGSTVESYLYNHCILNQDRTPSVIYDYVKEVNTEIQKFASAVLAYNWNEAIGVSGTADQTFRVSNIEYDENLEKITKFTDGKHFVSSESSCDMVVSQFTSDTYGEAYMFVNFGRKESGNNNVKANFKDCSAVAIYGGADYTGTPTIITLDESGNVSFELEYGEGVFAVPLV